MITLNSAQTFVDLLSGQIPSRPLPNEDYTYLEAHMPEKKSTWSLNPIKLYRQFRVWGEARRYERSLVNLYSISPHLLEDIGIVVDARRDMPDYLIPAPPRVAAQVEALRALPAEDLPVVAGASVGRPVVTTPKPARSRERFMPQLAAMHG